MAAELRGRTENLTKMKQSAIGSEVAEAFRGVRPTPKIGAISINYRVDPVGPALMAGGPGLGIVNEVASP